MARAANCCTRCVGLRAWGGRRCHVELLSVHYLMGAEALLRLDILHARTICQGSQSAALSKAHHSVRPSPTDMDWRCDCRPPQQGTASTGQSPQPGHLCSHQPAPGSSASQAPCSQACRTSNLPHSHPLGMTIRLAWSPDVPLHMQQSLTSLQLPLLGLQVSRLAPMMLLFVDMQCPCALSCSPSYDILSGQRRCRGAGACHANHLVQSSTLAVVCYLVHAASSCQ